MAINLTVVIIEEYQVLSSSYNILPNILLLWLTLYVVEITGDHQRRFRRNRSTADQTFCNCQRESGRIIEKPITYLHTSRKPTAREESILQQSHRLFVCFTDLGPLASSEWELTSENISSFRNLGRPTLAGDRPIAMPLPTQHSTCPTKKNVNTHTMYIHV